MKVLVTGAAGGIGSAAAAAFETAGHSVVRHDVATSTSTSTSIDLAGDLMEWDALDAVAALCRIEEVDAVIAAHGSAGSGELERISEDQIRRIMRINTLSVFRLYEAVRDHLVGRDGAFVTVSSQAGLEGEAQNGVYSASKFALVGWTKGVAAGGTSPRMRVICPGMTETPLLVAGLTGMAAEAGVTYEEYLGRRLANLPSRRLGRPDEIGRAIVWLTSLETRGAVLAAVTGGETFE